MPGSIAASMGEACELRTGVDDRDDGVFATRDLATGDTVMLGVPGRPAEANHSHANQVSLTAWVLEDGLGPKVNHCCDPNCGVRENPAFDGFDFVARRPIAAGEEITFDYAMRNHAIEHFPARCRLFVLASAAMSLALWAFTVVAAIAARASRPSRAAAARTGRSLAAPPARARARRRGCPGALFGIRGALLATALVLPAVVIARRRASRTRRRCGRRPLCAARRLPPWRRRCYRAWGWPHHDPGVKGRPSPRGALGVHRHEGNGLHRDDPDRGDHRAVAPRDPPAATATPTPSSG